MASITPTLNVDPNTMVTNWSGGLSNPTNQQKLINGYLKPRRAFNADPTGFQTAWTQGIQRAQAAGKYATGLQNADLTAAATNMQQYGGSNWSQSGTSKKYKYAAKAPALAAAINSVLATVNSMPTGKGGANEARMLAWSRGMGAYYGKI
jgi:hypothetical protein